MHLETLMKQYLELSQVVPEECKTARELKLLSAIEKAYGLLWHPSTTGAPELKARKILLEVLDKDGQRRGIEFARSEMSDNGHIVDQMNVPGNDPFGDALF